MRSITHDTKTFAAAYRSGDNALGLFFLHKNTTVDAKIYSDLAAVALADNSLTLCYRLWTAARALDRQGRGWVTERDLCAFWPQSKRTIRNVLNSEAGEDFWQLCDGVIFLKGLGAVCLALGANVGVAFWLPVTKMYGLKSFKAACYAATFSKSEEPTIISRQRLVEKFGKSRQTLRSYEKEARVQISFNVGRMTEEQYRARLFAVWDGTGQAPPRDRPDVFHYDGHVFFQLPNGYSAGLDKAARPAKVARKVRHALWFGRANDRTKRVFWVNESAAFNAAGKGRTNEVYYTKTRNRLSASTVWCWHEAL